MAVNWDFNNYRIIDGYLSQAIPQMDLKAEEARIQIGESGGLIYQIFRDASISGIPILSSLEDITDLQDYFAAVRGCLDTAKIVAEQHGFGLVNYKDSKVVTGLDAKGYIFQAGIGDAVIESPERIERFLQMIKEGRAGLQPSQALLEEKRKGVRTLDRR